MNNVESVLFGGIKERSLSVNVLFLKTETLVEKKVQALFLSVPTDVKKYSLLVVVLEVRVGSMGYQQLHNFVALFVVNQNG